MATAGARRSRRRKTLSRIRVQKLPNLRNEVAAAHISEAFGKLQEMGVLTGRTDKVSARIDHGLLAAAARKVGSNNTTEIIQAALAAFVAPDPFVEWFLSDRDRLPADFELAI